MPMALERGQFLFERLERDLRKLSAQQRPERVHSFRTNTRRLETLLEELVPRRSRNQKKLLKMLGAVRKRAGKLRDLDVQLAALRSLKIAQEPRRKTQLTQGLIELRTTHEKKLRKMLTRELLRETRRRLKKASKEVKHLRCRDPLAVARDILTRATAPAGPLTEDVLHQYRIRVKRARYASEFATRSTQSEQFTAQLKRLQDALGHWHDWLTLTHTATDLLGGVHESPLVAALHNVTAVKFRQAVAALSPPPTRLPGPKPVALPALAIRKPGAKTQTQAARTYSAA
jgi:CHAD domain-containing protein